MGLTMNDTAILVGSLLLLSSRNDEIEAIKNIINDGKKMDAVDFNVGQWLQVVKNSTVTEHNQASQVPGNAPPSVVWRPRGGLHSWWLCAAWLLLTESKGRRASCPLSSMEKGQSVPSCIEVVHNVRARTFVRTLPPASRQILPAAFSRGRTICVTTSRQQHKQTSDGQGRREDGHIGRHGLKATMDRGPGEVVGSFRLEADKRSNSKSPSLKPEHRAFCVRQNQVGQEG